MTAQLGEMRTQKRGEMFRLSAPGFVVFSDDEDLLFDTLMFLMLTEKQDPERPITAWRYTKKKDPQLIIRREGN